MDYELLTIKYTNQGFTISHKISKTIVYLMNTQERIKNNVPIAVSEDVLFAFINLPDKSISVITHHNKKMTKKEKEIFLRYLFTTYLIPQLKETLTYIKCKSKNGLVFYVSEETEKLLDPYNIDEVVVKKEQIASIVDTGILFSDAVKDLLRQIINTKNK